MGGASDADLIYAGSPKPIPQSDPSSVLLLRTAGRVAQH